MKISDANILNLSGKAFSVVLVTTIGFAFMFVVFPLFSDDFMYMEPMLGYFDRGEAPWAGLWENWVTHYFVDNLRLSNIVFTLFLLLPKWVGCSLSGVAVFITLRLMLLTACDGERPVSVWAAIWMCLLFTFGLPWNDQMVIMCFQFNYIWPGVSALLCLRIFLGDTRCRPLTALVLGFVAGWWHEGFAVPVIAGFAVLMVVWSKRFVTRINITLLAALVVGTLVIILVPSFFSRVSATNTGDILYNAIATLRYFIPGIIFVLLAATMMSWRRMRPAVLSPLCLFVLVCLAVNYVIHVRTHFAARISWWANLCAIMAIVHLAYRFVVVYPVSAKFAKAFKVLSIGAAALLTAHLACADVMTVKIKAETDDIVARYAAAADDADMQIFTDFTDQLSAPWLAFQKPYYNMFTYSWQYEHLRRRYGKKHELAVIPSQLEYVDGSQGALLPGGVRRIAKNIYYVRCTDDKKYSGGSGLVKIRGSYIPAVFYCSVFTSKADGKRYMYIFPANMAFRTWGSPIEDVVIKKYTEAFKI